MSVAYIPPDGDSTARVTLTVRHIYNNGVHMFTGLNGATGIIPCQFLPTATFKTGETATVEGETYAVKLTNGDTPEDCLFSHNVATSCLINTLNKTINFKAGGGLTNTKLAATTAEEEHVFEGYTFYSGDKTLKTGTYVKPTEMLVGNDVVYLVEVEDDSSISTPAITATSNDIRLGTTAVTSEGLIEGTKEIPGCETVEGQTLIMPGKALEIYLPTKDRYDYTALQCIVCAYNTSIDDSVAAQKIAVEDAVYPVNSTDAVSTVTKDATAKTIKLGLTNEGTTPLVIRYFTYKEIE